MQIREAQPVKQVHKWEGGARCGRRGVPAGLHVADDGVGLLLLRLIHLLSRQAIVRLEFLRSEVIPSVPRQEIMRPECMLSALRQEITRSEFLRPEFIQSAPRQDIMRSDIVQSKFVLSEFRSNMWSKFQPGGQNPRRLHSTDYKSCPLCGQAASAH